LRLGGLDPHQRVALELYAVQREIDGRRALDPDDSQTVTRLPRRRARLDGYIQNGVFVRRVTGPQASRALAF
jgi:hypothetical protein